MNTLKRKVVRLKRAVKIWMIRKLTKDEMDDLIRRNDAFQAHCENLNPSALGDYAKGWNACNHMFSQNLEDVPAFHF